MAGRVVRAAALAVLAMAAAACQPAPPSLARLYDDAQSAMRRGQVDAALAMANDGAARAEAAQDVAGTWRFRLLAADAYLTRLEFSDAMRVLEARIPDGAAPASLRGRQLHLLARARVSQGQLASAGPLIDEALSLAGDDAALRVDLELLRSQLLYRSGRAAEADALLSTTRSRVSGEGDAYRLAQVSVATGMGLVTRGRFDEALPYFERTAGDRAVDGTTIQALAFNNAGLCLARLGQFDRAIELQQQAVRIQEGGRKQYHVQALGELGNTFLLREDYARGAEYLTRAYTIAAEGGLASDAALFARNLTAALIALERWEEAARYHAAAVEMGARGGGASPYAIVNEARIAAGQGRSEEATRLFETALAEDEATPGVRWMSYEGLARQALAAGRRVEAARHFEAALQTVDRTRSALLRADDRISFTTRLTQFYRGYVELLLETGDFERALEVADSSRARVLAERQNVAAPAARASAASLKRLARQTGTALVFYWLGPERSRVWVVAGERISAAELPPAARIEALVTDHNAAIQNALASPLDAPGSAGERLHEMLVAPVSAELSRHDAVVIVPDGALHRLNFETLIVGGRHEPSGRLAAADRRYWIEDVTVQIAPSLGMLQASPSGPHRAEPSGPGRRAAVPPATSGDASPASLLLIGNATARPPDFPALSYAAAEMGSVTKHFPGGSVTVFDGERASPDSFRQAAPERFSVIHFTSHAVANPDTPLDSAVILSGPDQAYKLYARDVANAKLRAELVTVSACRSAGERAYAGEGLVGFAWAFLRGGSRRVIAGLWDVDDRSTAALMDHVYARMAEGASPAAALRDAKRALIRDGYAKPYYWAPFQVFTTVV